jgi:hypothetical protein
MSSFLKDLNKYASLSSDPFNLPGKTMAFASYLSGRGLDLGFMKICPNQRSITFYSAIL